MRKIARNLLAVAITLTMMSAVVTDNIPKIYAQTDEVEDIVISNEEVLTSDRLHVYGFQIRTGYDEEGNPDISFRAIGSAPAIGSTIVVDGKEYTIARTGLIYTLDDDCSGDSSKRVLSKDYTVLAEDEIYTDELGNEYYEGANTYKGGMRTYGFLSTEKGYGTGFKFDYKDEIKKELYKDNVPYIRTMTNMNPYMLNSIQIRAFVLADDGTIIYAEKASTMCIAGIAYEMYVNKMMKIEEQHNFLYKYILHSKETAKRHQEDPNYKYYLDYEVDFRWSIVVKP